MAENLIEKALRDAGLLPEWTKVTNVNINVPAIGPATITYDTVADNGKVAQFIKELRCDD